jgi:hypothetical protein
MGATLTAIEVTGVVDEQHQLQLDNLLPIAGPKRVRVIVLYPPDNESGELDETEWRRAAASNPVFQFLHDPGEDIYSLADGKPLHDEI